MIIFARVHDSLHLVIDMQGETRRIDRSMTKKNVSLAKRIHLLKSVQWGLATGVFLAGVYTIVPTVLLKSYNDGLALLGLIFVGLPMYAAVFSTIAIMVYLVIFNVADAFRRPKGESSHD